MVNHEGKANRRFQRRVQVRIHASENAICYPCTCAQFAKPISRSLLSKPDCTTRDNSHSLTEKSLHAAGLLSAGRNDILAQWIMSLRLRC